MAIYISDFHIRQIFERTMQCSLSWTDAEGDSDSVSPSGSAHDYYRIIYSGIGMVQCRYKARI